MPFTPECECFWCYINRFDYILRTRDPTTLFSSKVSDKNGYEEVFRNAFGLHQHHSERYFEIFMTGMGHEGRTCCGAEIKKRNGQNQFIFDLVRYSEIFLLRNRVEGFNIPNSDLAVYPTVTILLQTNGRDMITNIHIIDTAELMANVMKMNYERATFYRREFELLKSRGMSLNAQNILSLVQIKNTCHVVTLNVYEYAKYWYGHVPTLSRAIQYSRKFDYD